MEDTIQIATEPLAGEGIEVIREYERSPLVMAEKHLVLQILVNLVQNAAHALNATEGPRWITFHIGHRDDGFVNIRVSDNGKGSSEEVLSRLFMRGFTTKKEGHGFGLHFSLMAAQAMGGGLVAKSNGEGKGASFTLRLVAKK